MNGFIALFAVDFAKIGIEMNNEPEPVIPGCPSLAVAPAPSKTNPAPNNKGRPAGQPSINKSNVKTLLIPVLLGDLLADVEEVIVELSQSVGQMAQDDYDLNRAGVEDTFEVFRTDYLDICLVVF